MNAVLDASFLGHALIPTQRLGNAETEFNRLLAGNANLAAPQLLQTEFVSAIRRLERRQRLTSSQVDFALRALESLGVRYSWDDAWVPRALQISRQINSSTIYDCVYLACAESLDCDLYTCDAAFCRAFGGDLPARIILVR